MVIHPLYEILLLLVMAMRLSLQVSSLHDQPVAIAFSLCLFGFFALPLIPACMELGVEVTYPVAEATSSGLLWSAVYVLHFYRIPSILIISTLIGLAREQLIKYCSDYRLQSVLSD